MHDKSLERGGGAAAWLQSSAVARAAPVRRLARASAAALYSLAPTAHRKGGEASAAASRCILLEVRLAFARAHAAAAAANLGAPRMRTPRKTSSCPARVVAGVSYCEAHSTTVLRLRAFAALALRASRLHGDAAHACTEPGGAKLVRPGLR